MQTKQRVLIVGGCGYVGSRLYDVLTEHRFYPDSVDLEWFGNHSGILNDQKDYAHMEPSEFAVYDAIVLLAGHTSVKMSGDGLSTMRNNVDNFVSLLDRLSSLPHPPKVIYSSSSSVYGNSKSKQVKESDDKFVPNNFYDLSKHEIDLYATMYNSIGKLQIYGLRFGTINGWSKNLRVDVMINAMFSSAITNKHINLFNPQVHRPILGIEDLCKAVVTILHQGTRENVGLYNLASFTSTSEEIAKRVSKALDNTTVMLRAAERFETSDLNIKLQTMAYDFSMDTTKFQHAFNFKFKDTIESIVNGLKEGEHTVVKTYRNQMIVYPP